MILYNNDGSPVYPSVGCTADQYERHMENLRDNLHGRSEGSSARGKTVRMRKQFSEASSISREAEIEGLEDLARHGNVLCQYKVALKYEECGDLEKAQHWMQKVASYNYDGAEDALARIRSKMRIVGSHVQSL